MAKSAIGGSERNEYCSIQALPRSVQKNIFFDRIGIPNFRSPRK